MSIKHLAAISSADHVAPRSLQDGAVIVDELVSPAVMDTVAEELRPFTRGDPIWAG